MATSAMVSVKEARARARRKVEQDQRSWAALGGNDAVLEIALHPPTERSVLADHEAAYEWVRAWHALGGAEVRWGSRQWPSAGSQAVPERCVLQGADAIAEFAGAVVLHDWRRMRDRAARIRDEFAGEASGDSLAAAIRTHGGAIQRLAEPDFVTLLDVVTWLSRHPSSGWRIRQLPIRGIDTKWLEGHRTLVEALHAAVTGRSSLGLLAAPGLVRVRFLDPALRPGGLMDVSAPVDELADMSVAPTAVFVFENLETVLAMPEVQGAVAVHGSGYAASRLGRIPWIRSGRVIYWGDLDSDGFAILHALRSGCENVSSTLMDEATLLAFRDLWVPENRPASGTYPTLTAAELTALQRIRAEGNVRLEQERIPWALALATLMPLVAMDATRDFEVEF